MNVHYSKELPQAFVIGSSELQEIVSLFREYIGAVSIRVKCSDDFSRDFETVKELIAYRNPKSKEIRRIYLTASSDDYKKSGAITFVDSTGTGILIDFKGPEDTVSTLRDQIMDVIAGMRPWYAAITYIKFMVTIAFVFGFISSLWISPVILREIMEFRGTPISDNIGEDTDLTSELLHSILYLSPINLILWGIVLFLSRSFLNNLYTYLFPRSIFTIGQGKSRFKQQQKVLWGVIIAFFVSLAAGVVVLILS